MRVFIYFMACGAAFATGQLIVEKIDEVISDPYKRASIKKNVTDIKSTFTN